MKYLLVILLLTVVFGLSLEKSKIFHLRANSTTVINIDFSKPSSEKRLTVTENGAKIYETWVTHGRASGELYAKSFSNVPNSHKSSLGTMRVGEKYYGKHGLSYKLIGLDKGVNDNVGIRAIVIHSADYIGYGKTGRSLGCLAIPTRDYQEFLKYVKPGVIVSVYK